MPVPSYAIDDQTALQVVDGEASVVCEGHWKRFTRLWGWELVRLSGEVIPAMNKTRVFEKQLSSHL